VKSNNVCLPQKKFKYDIAITFVRRSAAAVVHFLSR
jgi:hypothetical protein